MKQCLVVMLVLFAGLFAQAQITDLADLCAAETYSTMDVLAQGAAGCAKIAFVTSTLYSGNLGGTTSTICTVSNNKGHYNDYSGSGYDLG